MAAYNKVYFSRSGNNPTGGPGGGNFGCYIHGAWNLVRFFVSYISPIKQGDGEPVEYTDGFTQRAAWPVPTRYMLHMFSTAPLKKQTLGGTVDMVMGLKQRSPSTTLRLHVHAWILRPDCTFIVENNQCIPTTPGVDTMVRGIVVNDYEDPVGRALPTVSTGFGFASPQVVPPIEVEDGDMLVVEYGIIFDTPVAVDTDWYVDRWIGSVTDKPPSGAPLNDLTIGSTATSTNAGHLVFSQPLQFIDPPANDSCSTPRVISALPYTDGPYNAQMASYEPGVDTPSTCAVSNFGGGYYNTVWYRYTAAVSGTMRLETKPFDAPDGMAMRDSELTVYTGSCAALTQVACAQGYNGYGALIKLSVVAGTTYLIKVGARSLPGPSGLVVAARMVTPPPNDNCASAALISAIPFSHQLDTTLATKEAGEPISDNGWTYNDCTVWYKWTADSVPGNIRVSTMGSHFDSMVTIWDGACGSFTEVFGAPWTNTVDPDDSGDYAYYDQAECVFTPIAGHTYYFQVSTKANDYWNNRGGDLLNFAVTRAPNPPSNETLATAKAVPSIPAYFTFDITDAADAIHDIVPLGDCDWFTMADNDSGKVTWWKWTADRTAPMNFNTFGGLGGGPYTEVVIYTGPATGATPANIVPIMCDGLNLNSWQTQLFFDAVKGTTYYWRIDSQGRISGIIYFFLDEDYTDFKDGDVVIGADWVYLFTGYGAFRRLVAAHGDVPTASGLDPNTGFLYQSLFVGNYMMRMNARLDELGTFTTEPGVIPEVPGFFEDGRLFVGHWGDRSTWDIDGLVDPTFGIRQFDPDTGALLDVLPAKQERTGTAWLDPLSDQRTLAYTSYGRKVMHFDIVSRQQLPDIATLPGAFPTFFARGIRQRPNGEFMITDGANVKRISAAGIVLQVYPIDDCVSLNVIDQVTDGSEFWVGDLDSTGLYRVSVATGAIVLKVPGGPFGAVRFREGHGQLCGISVIGGFRAGAPPPPPPVAFEPIPPAFVSINADPVPQCEVVSRRLGDPDRRIWSDAEIDSYLLQASKELTTSNRLIWDWVYPENLPRGFSFTAPFEEALTTWHYGPGDGSGSGMANFTAEFERRLNADQPQDPESGSYEDVRDGFARHTFPDEIPFLVQSGAAQQQPTSELPFRLTEVERVAWDARTIDADIHRNHRYANQQYETITGEVISYTWRKDGPRTLRKIRVPAQVADVYETKGSWGGVRRVTDLDFVDALSGLEGDWGAARQVPGEHPIGPRHTAEPWGLPRRFFRAGNNTKVEHWRTAYVDCLETEIPARYRKYLEWYAMYRCLSRQSPGQNVELADWYRGRWADGMARINRRIGKEQSERIGRLGGLDPRSGRAQGPPRPSLPWQYGKRVR